MGQDRRNLSLSALRYLIALLLFGLLLGWYLSSRNDRADLEQRARDLNAATFAQIQSQNPGAPDNLKVVNQPDEPQVLDRICGVGGLCLFNLGQKIFASLDGKKFTPALSIDVLASAHKEHWYFEQLVLDESREKLLVLATNHGPPRFGGVESNISGQSDFKTLWKVISCSLSSTATLPVSTLFPSERAGVSGEAIQISAARNNIQILTATYPRDHILTATSSRGVYKIYVFNPINNEFTTRAVNLGDDNPKFLRLSPVATEIAYATDYRSGNNTIGFRICCLDYESKTTSVIADSTQVTGTLQLKGIIDLRLSDDGRTMAGLALGRGQDGQPRTVMIEMPNAPNSSMKVTELAKSLAWMPDSLVRIDRDGPLIRGRIRPATFSGEILRNGRVYRVLQTGLLRP